MRVARAFLGCAHLAVVRDVAEYIAGSGELT